MRLTVARGALGRRYLRESAQPVKEPTQAEDTLAFNALRGGFAPGRDVE
jgi:hypothetical protein